MSDITVFDTPGQRTAATMVLLRRHFKSHLDRGHERSQIRSNVLFLALQSALSVCLVFKLLQSAGAAISCKNKRASELGIPNDGELGYSSENIQLL